MEPSLCHRTLSGMLGFYSCSQHLLRLTLDWSPSIVHLFRRWNHAMILTMVIISTVTIICIIRHKTYYDDYSHYNSLIIALIAIILIICFRLAGICGLSSTIRARLQETCSQCHPIQSILGKLAVVPVGDTGTIPYHLRNVFSGAPGDRQPGAGDGCGMWFVNSWALGWSRDM